MTGQSGTAELATDAELISAARSGDGIAYGVLYERHVDAATRLARHIVRDHADVDDVVAETFARVLSTIRNGAGPTEAFRPYLLTAVRRVAFDQMRTQRSQVPSDVADLPDSAGGQADEALENLERSLVARAFMALPERWSAVLWHTEVEQIRPAEIGLLLGLSPNAVAALSYRAREGLRQAYLQLHLSDRARPACAPVAARLAAHVRGGLSSREARKVDRHLRRCRDCSSAHAELTWINSTLRSAYVPVLLGLPSAAEAAHAALAGLARAGGSARMGGSAHAGATRMAGATRIGGAARGVSQALVRHPVIAGATTLAVAAGVVQVGLGIPHLRTGLPPVTAPPVKIAPAGSTAPPRSHGTAAPRTTPPGHGRRTGRSPSPRPTPSGTPTPVPSPTPTPSGTPTPSPSSPGVVLRAKLSVGVQVQGLLGLGVATTVSVRVGNVGSAPTGKLNTVVTLPAGVLVIALPVAGSGWTCAPDSSGAIQCTHRELAAGATASASFSVLVVSLTGCGNGLLATVTSGSLSAQAQSSTQVQCLLGVL
ncbi:MAG: sigma-70 family RNA polymerase sigma factor [Streptosporangiaceae bacterium]